MTSNTFVGDERMPDDPTDLDRDDYLAAFKRAFAEIKDDDVPGLAAGVAFKMFLALFPALLAAVAVFSIVMSPAEINDLLEEASAFMPNDALRVVEGPIKNLGEKGGAAGWAAVTGIAAGLWAATSAAVSLMKALSRAYDVDEDRKFVRQRLVALALTFALLLALIAIALLLVFGPQIQQALLPGLVAPFTWLLAIARFALALLVLVVLFAFVYWAGPDRDHPSWVWMSPGAFFGVVGWLLVAGGFTLYAQTAGSYDATYGAIAGVAVLMIWLQLSMLVILVGGEFNAEVERTRSLDVAVNEGAGFAAPAVAGAMVTGETSDGKSVVAEAHAAHAMDERAGEADPSMTLAPPVSLADTAPWPAPTRGTNDDSATGNDDDTAPMQSLSSQLAAVPTPAKKLGAVTAGVMAGAVFLGFARRRARR